MGEKPVEDAKRNYGEDRVEGVIFSSAAKLDMATSLKEAFQDRRVLVPAGDPKLRADLHSIKSVTGPTGIRRLVSDGETDGHADRFWADALAVSSAETEYQPYSYRPVRLGREGDVNRQLEITAGFGAIKGVF